MLSTYSLKTLFLLIVVSSLAFPAQAVEELPLSFNLGGGVLLPGEAEVDISPPVVEVKTQAAFLLKAGVDVKIFRHAFLSGCVLHSQVTLNKEAGFLSEFPSSYQNDTPAWVSGIQFSLGPKVNLLVHEGLTLQMALYGGYRSISSDADIANSIGFALDGTLALHINLPLGFTNFYEIGFLNQPYGGKQDYYYLTFGPLLYLLVGFSY